MAAFRGGLNGLYLLNDTMDFYDGIVDNILAGGPALRIGCYPAKPVPLHPPKERNPAFAQANSACQVLYDFARCPRSCGVAANECLTGTVQSLKDSSENADDMDCRMFPCLLRAFGMSWAEAAHGGVSWLRSSLSALPNSLL